MTDDTPIRLHLHCDCCGTEFRTPVLLSHCPDCAHDWNTVEHNNGWARPQTTAELRAAARRARRTVIPLRPRRRTA